MVVLCGCDCVGDVGGCGGVVMECVCFDVYDG